MATEPGGPWRRPPGRDGGRRAWRAASAVADGPQPAGCWLPEGAERPAERSGWNRRAWYAGYRHAAVVSVITIASSVAWHGHDAGAMRAINPAGWALLAVICAALVLRPRFPVATLGIVAAGVSAYFALGNPPGTVFLPLAIAFGTAVLSGHRLIAWLTCPFVYAFIIWGNYLAGTGPLPKLSEAVTNAAWPLVILIGAEMLRAGRERAATAARSRSEHARRQAEQARRRTSEERVRIAQELHDVVAHNISLINVQAGVALHLMDSEGERSPEQARAALAAIKQASKETLGELRSVLGILRAEPGEHAPLTPAAGLDQLDGLIAGASTAGLIVHPELTGDRVPLPPSTDLAAYRIIQEALTNVIKHVGPATVTVRLSYRETSLDIQVTDDGGASTRAAAGAGWASATPGASATSDAGLPSGTGGAGRTSGVSGADRASVAAGSTGHRGTGRREAFDYPADGGGSGIAGMRERTRMLGGEFSAGPLSAGGFRVSVVLPLRRSDDAKAETDNEDGVAAADPARHSHSPAAGPGGAA